MKNKIVKKLLYNYHKTRIAGGHIPKFHTQESALNEIFKENPYYGYVSHYIERETSSDDDNLWAYNLFCVLKND